MDEYHQASIDLADAQADIAHFSGIIMEAADPAGNAMTRNPYKTDVQVLDNGERVWEPAADDSVFASVEDAIQRAKEGRADRPDRAWRVTDQRTGLVLFHTEWCGDVLG